MTGFVDGVPEVIAVGPDRSVWPLSWRVLALVATLALILVAPHAKSVAQNAAVPPVAIIGVDAGDWQTIDRIVSAARLPTFATLKKIASLGTVRPDPPILSPIIWTTIATGRRPEDHGVLDFMVDVPGGGQAPVSGGARRTKALWEIFSDAGRPVLVSGWWATWPADSVRGVIVSDRVATPHIHLQSSDVGLVFPQARRRDVEAAHVAPEAIDYAAFNRFVPLTRQEFDAAVAADRDSVGRLYRNRFAHTRAALTATRTHRAVTTLLAPVVRPAFLAVYYELIDTVSHLFVQDPDRREAAITSAYREIDEAMAETARALDPETLVIVMSDHGFYSATAGIPDDPADLTAGAASWHRPYGIVAVTTAGTLTGLRPAGHPTRLGAVSPLDIAPSLLVRAGLPVADDMPGHVIPELAGDGRVTKVASYGAHTLPEQLARRDSAITNGTVERLRALGYVSGTSAVTSLARVNLGEILFRKGDFTAAIRELEAVLRAEPLNQRAALWLARAYTSSNRPDDAVRLYDRLFQASIAGASIEPLVILAATDLDLQRGRADVAADRLRRVPSSLAQTPETLIARGALAEAEGKPDRAEELFRTVLSRQHTNIDALSRLIDLLIRTGTAGRAGQIAANEARRFPESPERHALVGEVALAERRYADASRSFSAALALAPDSSSLRVELARASLLQNRADAALEALDGAGTSREADMLRGAAYSKKHDWAAAVTSYEGAVGAGSPSVDLLNALGNAQLEAGRPGEALATLQRSLSLKGDQPEIRLLVDRARRAVRQPPS